jgi:RES domain-containing protein
VSLGETPDEAVTFVGSPYDVGRVVEGVYLDQAEHNFQEYIHRTLAASQSYGGRYNPAGEFGAIYTASDEETAWYEVASRFERDGVHGLPSTMGLLRIVVHEGRYVDMFADPAREAWEADLTALVANAPDRTQQKHCWELGRAIRAVADFLMAPSARHDGANIPLFPDRENGTLRHTLHSILRNRVPAALLQKAKEEW